MANHSHCSNNLCNNPSKWKIIWQVSTDISWVMFACDKCRQSIANQIHFGSIASKVEHKRGRKARSRD